MAAIGHNRKYYSIYAQATSGSDYLNKFSYKLGQAESPTCRLCNEDDNEEDFLHILTKCPAVLTTVNHHFSNPPNSEMNPLCQPVRKVVSFLEFLDLESDIDLS